MALHVIVRIREIFYHSGNPPPPERNQDWKPETPFCTWTRETACPSIRRTEPLVFSLRYVSRVYHVIDKMLTPCVYLEYFRLLKVRQPIINIKGLFLIPWFLKTLCSSIPCLPPKYILGPFIVIYWIFCGILWCVRHDRKCVYGENIQQFR